MLAKEWPERHAKIKIQSTAAQPSNNQKNPAWTRTTSPSEASWHIWMKDIFGGKKEK